jgi:phenylpropionate dioxygenase-like ring-hydroxylating dioxygenase large terminal subunit
MATKLRTDDTLSRLVDGERGLVSREIFFDGDIYKKELERIFARVWLYLAHETQIPKPGDFVTNYMGEDPVIISRDNGGQIRVFLNSCRHRGMKICRADGGNARQFTCPFHGWTYASDGRLAGVPMQEASYGVGFDRSQWSLVEAPKIASYAGMIFASWDANAMPLDAFLGDMRWYLDIMLERPLGGLEVVPGQQRYACNSNWKIASENFAGDCYHLPYSHGSLFRLKGVRQLNPVGINMPDRLYHVSTANGHGLTSVNVADERYQADLAMAKEMGPEIIEYVEESHARLARKLSAAQTKVYALGFGNLFPNLSFNDFSALRPTGFYLWIPKGPGSIEAWQWCLVDRAAPKAVKDIARIDFSRVQATTGIAGQDDTENFEQVTEATRGVVGRRLDFVYSMGIEKEGTIPLPGYPGLIGRYYTENGQRNLYRHWAKLMGEG